MSEPTGTDESESDSESELSYNSGNSQVLKHGLYADREILFDSLEGVDSACGAREHRLHDGNPHRCDDIDASAHCGQSTRCDRVTRVCYCWWNTRYDYTRWRLFDACLCAGWTCLSPIRCDIARVGDEPLGDIRAPDECRFGQT